MQHQTMQMKRCPKCHLFNAQDALVCDRCGQYFQPFTQPASQQPAAPYFDAAGQLYQSCNRCGQVSVAGLRFCASCGQQFIPLQHQTPAWRFVLPIWLSIPILLTTYPYLCPYGIGNDWSLSYQTTIPTVLVWCCMAVGALILDFICACFLSGSPNKTDRRTAQGFFALFVIGFLIVTALVFQRMQASYRTPYADFAP